MLNEQSCLNFFDDLIGLYHEHRISKFPRTNVFRGRSSSVSSDLEDLFASFIAEQSTSKCNYFIDQSMKFEGEKTNKYPDIVIQTDNGVISHLIDMKADIGWNRDGIYALCLDWNSRINNAKGKETTFKKGFSKEVIKSEFSEDLHYHVVIVSQKNASAALLNDYEKVKELKNVSLYILSDGAHPNQYGVEKSELLKKISIKFPEFERLLNAITK